MRTIIPNPKPYTLNPKPLNPTPYTLNPTPYRPIIHMETQNQPCKELRGFGSRIRGLGLAIWGCLQAGILR